MTAFFKKFVAAASTLTLGACMAYVINILMSFYERKISPRSKNRYWQKLRRPVCMFLAFATIILAVYLLLQTIVPQLVECFNKLIAALVDGAPRFYEWLDKHTNIDQFLKSENSPIQIPSDAAGWSEQLLDLLKKYSGPLANGVGDILDFAVTATSGIISFVVSLLLGLIFAVYILSSKEKLKRQFDSLFQCILGEKVMRGVRHILHVLDECFHSYIVGQLIEAMILGSLCALGMWVLRLPDPLMIGTLVGVTALVPIAGAYIGSIVGAIMILATSPDPIQAVIFVVFLTILQQIEGNLIYPRTVGSSLHLPGIWVLAAVTIGGVIWQIPGMIIFVPLTAAVYRLLGEWVQSNNGKSLLDSIVSISRQEPAANVAANVEEAAPASKPNKPQPRNKRR